MEGVLRPGQALPLTAIFLVLFMMMVLVVSYYPLGSFDLSLMAEIQGNVSQTALVIMTVISQAGYLMPALILAGAAAVFIATTPLRLALLPLALVIPADLTTLAIKQYIDRPRPPAFLVTVHQLLTDPGFPSAHVVHYTVFFGFLAYFFWKAHFLPVPARSLLSACCLLMVVSVSFSRMYLGAHWPTDVLGGYLLGGAFLITQIRFFQKYVLQAAE